MFLEKERSCIAPSVIVILLTSSPTVIRTVQYSLEETSNESTPTENIMWSNEYNSSVE